MRSPVNVLVLPFRGTVEEGFSYAVFRRSDGDASCWQAVAGGVEGKEKPLGAAKRELEEETGLARRRRWLRLDAHATVPARLFRDWPSWGPNVYVVRELAFGAEVGPNEVIRLSDEHAELAWLTYPQARERLRWDSNRTALWELHTRLTEGAAAPADLA